MSSIPANALGGPNAVSPRTNVSSGNNPSKAKDVAQSSPNKMGPAAYVKQREPASVTTYTPHQSGTVGKGPVKAPKTDVATQQVNQFTARANYDASLKVIQAWDKKQDSVIDIKS